jgi:Ca2+-binding RTX toxin-like protein
VFESFEATGSFFVPPVQTGPGGIVIGNGHFSSGHSGKIDFVASDGDRIVLGAGSIFDWKGEHVVIPGQPSNLSTGTSYQVNGDGTTTVRFVSSSATFGTAVSSWTLTGSFDLKESFSGSHIIVGIDRIEGTAGGDTLTAKSTDTSLYGHDGNDTLIGGAKDDWLFGGEGIDTADYRAATSGVNVSLGLLGRIRIPEARASIGCAPSRTCAARPSRTP